MVEGFLKEFWECEIEFKGFSKWFKGLKNSSRVGSRVLKNSSRVGSGV